MKRSGKRARGTEGRLKPSIDSLRVFVELGDRIRAATEQGTNFASLSEAADSMSSSYSKSNVFRALDELRKVYGRQLVNRNTVTMTSEGETVYAWARELLQLHARGQRWPIGEREQIRIGTSNWLLNFVLPDLLPPYLQHQARRKRRDPTIPDVDLVFSEYDVERLLVDLRKGAVHAGIAAIFPGGSWPDLVAETVRPGVATVMIASSEHPRWGAVMRTGTQEVALAEVAIDTVCVLDADLYRVLSGLPRPRPRRNRILVESYVSVVALVRTGAVVGFVPQLDLGRPMKHPAYQGLEVYSVKDQPLTRTLAILRRSGEELPEAAEAFLRIAAETLR